MDKIKVKQEVYGRKSGPTCITPEEELGYSDSDLLGK